MKKFQLTSALLILILSAPLLARQVELLDYFPHGLGDSWQYTCLNPPLSNLPGFIELQVTGIDTLQDGTRLVYVNNYSEPRWRIDSTGVYTLPMMIREAVIDAGISDSWSMYRDSLLGISSDRTLHGVDTLTIFETDRSVALFKDEGYPFHRSPAFVQHIGYYADQNDIIYNRGWKLTAAIIDGDTLGTWQPGYAERLTDWMPVAVGNLWQYLHVSRSDSGPWESWIREWKITGVDTLTDDRWIVHINDESRFEMDFARGEIYDMKYDDIYFKFSDMMQRYKTARIHTEYDGSTTILAQTYRDATGITYRDYFSEMFSLAGTRRFKNGVGWIESPMDVWGNSIELQSYVIDGDTTGTYVSIDPSERHVPAGFTLHQNYPNPFNPSTVIRYTLPEAGPVRLEVFDITGRRVAMLRDQVMTAGSHSDVFDASRLSSGMYVYRLTGNGRTEVRKMLLLK
ncbi:MAG: T9SS type A sorting domain-containing protein [Rhodothermaceae bacterium]|nr:T9SS type A sorting domain-containing protein [Rhodothermaceae bacterium]